MNFNAKIFLILPLPLLKVVNVSAQQRPNVILIMADDQG